MKADILASWYVSLYAECPSCNEEVDLVENDFFWVDCDVEPIEHGTERADNLPVQCPKCNAEFRVCCEY